MTEQHRFICDEMLLRLGRWLRAAGYDTVIASNAALDQELMLQARQEDRVLITRDRKFVEYKDATQQVIVLYTNSTEECAHELAQRLSIDWLFNPFSRCMVCNTPLATATAAEFERVPDKARQAISELFICQGCGRLYWEGSHVRRMRHQLKKWQREGD